MLLSDYFLKKYVEQQYERMSMEPPREKELEPKLTHNPKNALHSDIAKDRQQVEKKLHERLGINPKQEMSYTEILKLQDSVNTFSQSNSKGKSLSMK